MELLTSRRRLRSSGRGALGSSPAALLVQELEARGQAEEHEQRRLEQLAVRLSQQAEAAVQKAAAAYCDYSRACTRRRQTADELTRARIGIIAEENDAATSGLLAVDPHLLASVASCLAVPDLGRLACVCRRFSVTKSIADNAAGGAQAGVRSIVEEAARLLLGRQEPHVQAS